MIIRASFWLSYQDSNLDKQNQKLLCYHYTIRQSHGHQSAATPPRRLGKRCKVTTFF